MADFDEHDKDRSVFDVIIIYSSSFLVRPKRVEYLPGKSQSVNTLLKHQRKSSQVVHSAKDCSIKTSIVE